MVCSFTVKYVKTVDKTLCIYKFYCCVCDDGEGKADYIERKRWWKDTVKNRIKPVYECTNVIIIWCLSLEIYYCVAKFY